MEIKRREGESLNAFLFRFTKKMRQSGVLQEAKKRRFHSRPKTKIKIKLSALHREAKKRKFEKARRMGKI